MTNTYQLNKARKIATTLLTAYSKSNLANRTELIHVAARMSPAQWQAVSFVARVPLADIDCKRAVIDILRKRNARVSSMGQGNA